MAVRVTRAGVALTVGIIVLAGLIIGGLLWAKELGEQARREEAIQIANENLEDQSNNDVANEDRRQNEPQNEQPANGQGQNNAQEIPVTGRDTEQEVAELPQTGPGDSLFSIFVVALLAFTGASYVRSRQHRR